MADEEFLARIAPLDAGIERPQWSVLIPTYNCAAFLEEALASVLAQDPGPERMEIFVIDDHSTRDDPADVVRRIGRDRVTFVRQSRNVGKVRNYETGLHRSRGMLIHQLHGDDRVRPGFYAAMEDAFGRFPSAGAIFCESLIVDDAGRVSGRTGGNAVTGLLDRWLEKIYVEQQLQAPSMVMRRAVYERLGGFDRRLDLCEDWEMWIRVANSFPVGYLAEPLAEYRVTASSSSTAAMLSGAVTSALREVMRIADGYVPPEIVSDLSDRRNRQAAQYLTQFIPPLLRAGRYKGVAGVFRDALSFSAHPRTIYRLVNYTLNSRQLSQA